MTTTAAATTKTKKRKARITTFDVVVYFILIALMILMLYPLLFVVSASFSDPKMVAAGKMLLLPVEPNLDGYKYIFQYKEIWTGYLNTIFYTFFWNGSESSCNDALCLCIVQKRPAGTWNHNDLLYDSDVFQRRYDPRLSECKESWTSGYPRDDPGQWPGFYLQPDRMPYLLPDSDPYELQEAAVIDGCDDFQIFTKIIFPLAKPITVVMALYYGVGRWNSYFVEMIYLKDRGKFPLQLFLREILTKSTFAKQAMINGQSFSAEEMMALIKQADTANMIKYGVIVISTLPMMMIYPFLQKYFEKGIMIGSVKG